MNGQWLMGDKPGPEVEIRLFCFPFAGGSAAAYRMWSRLAPRHVHVSGVEYPGRGMRLAEEPVRSLPPLIRNLAGLIEPLLHEPFAFFGHSMGGIVAYELTRALRARGVPQPRHLFISGAGAPGEPSALRCLADAGDDEVIEELRTLGGTPPELFDNAELMELAVRALRADSTALGTYEHREQPPLQVPITVFGGRADDLVPPAHLRGWSALTTAGCRLRLFPGDHFFLYPASREILATVSQTLGRRVETAVAFA